MELLADLVLELLDNVLHKSKSARTQIVVDTIVIAILLLLAACAIWA